MLPPPDSNSRDRFTVATPSLIERPSSLVAAGITVEIAGLAAASALLGPASSAVIAAVATALVIGISRRTGTRPSLPVALPRMK